MNKFLKIALPLAGVAATAVYLTAPGRAKKEQKAPFVGRNFAHRGLYTEDQSIPENSLTAFDMAAEEGYGIELDVHISADDRIVVFHDDDLERICGEEGRVEDMFWRELKEYYLYDSTEHMPLLSDVLNIVDGRCPIILELKPDKRRTELCERTLEFLRSYKGDVCIESFDPFIVRWFKINAPDILRGQLSQRPRDYKGETSRCRAFLLGNLLTNFLCRPQFVAYKIGRKPLTVHLCNILGAIKTGWTAHEPTAERKSDMVIFEHFRPCQRFK